MIESENLRTASLYINNQLLSRGLLRDGSGIDFARPGDDDAEVAETMSRIMAVVNDLILRRDVSIFQFSALSSCCLSNPPLTPCSAMPNTASPSRPHYAPSAPSRCARPTTSSASKKNTRTRSARSA